MIDLLVIVWKLIEGVEIEWAEFGLVGSLIGAFVLWRRERKARKHG